MQGGNPATEGRDVHSGRWRQVLGGPPRELLLGAFAALVSMIPIAWFARDYWFRYDDFPLLAGRQVGSLDDWFKPHHDHWLTWTILLSHGLYRVVGADYWPWWYLPRLIGHAAVAFLIWRVVLYRGADKVVAFGAYLALLVLAVSYFQDALTVANYVVFPCIVVVALVVSRVEVPTRRDLVVVGVCLAAAVMANGYGVALLAAVTVLVVAERRLPRWAPALVPVAVMVVIWYLRYRSELTHHDHALPGFVFSSIRSSFVVVRTALENTFGLAAPPAVLLLLVLAGAVVWLFATRRLDRFDAVIGLTFVLVLAVLAWGRSSQPGQSETLHYGYAVILLLTLLIVPHVRFPAGSLACVAVVAVLVAVVAFNMVSLSRRLDQTGVVSQSIRKDAETTGALIAAGEPYSDYATIGRGVQPKLIRQLVDDGWKPPRPTDAALVIKVRVRMRFVVGGDGAQRAAAAPDRVAPAAAGVGRDGCLRVTAPSIVRLSVWGPSTFRVNRKVIVTWTDRFGRVRATAGPAVVALAWRAGRPMVTARTTGLRPTVICGLQPLGRG